jgi:cellulose biosynthesis protein BcsQ
MPRSFEKSSYKDKDKYLRNRKVQRDRERNRKRNYINSKKQDCFFCGADKNKTIIEFHHKNPVEKEFTISNMKWMSYDKINSEIMKCWCLCQKCHTKLHQRLLDPLPESYDILITDTEENYGPLTDFFVKN